MFRTDLDILRLSLTIYSTKNMEKLTKTELTLASLLQFLKY